MKLSSVLAIEVTPSTLTSTYSAKDNENQDTKIQHISALSLTIFFHIQKAVKER